MIGTNIKCQIYYPLYKYQLIHEHWTTNIWKKWDKVVTKYSYKLYMFWSKSVFAVTVETWNKRFICLKPIYFQSDEGFHDQVRSQEELNRRNTLLGSIYDLQVKHFNHLTVSIWKIENVIWIKQKRWRN